MKYPDKIRELYHCFLNTLVNQGCNNPENVAFALLLDFCEQEGGLKTYFPKKNAVEKFFRDESINLEFSGRNIRELAKKNHLSEQQIRNILKNF
jgi:Mor family transcriptional regulator